MTIQAQQGQPGGISRVWLLVYENEKRRSSILSKPDIDPHCCACLLAGRHHIGECLANANNNNNAISKDDVATQVFSHGNPINMVSIQFYIRLITTLVLLSSIVTSQRQMKAMNTRLQKYHSHYPPKTTTPQGYEYPVPQNPLQLPRRGRRRPLESHKITPGRTYITCTDMAKDKKVTPRPGVNCLHTAKINVLDIEDKTSFIE
ncbi:unnamed protein product [Lepeophtheirus salmonis]|uniref:(salmon louse) hypothetical protein n=1 Tax=Lepeophtheirus salmonis TaxID=72036 RepID=A0A817F9K0_LEPSM|nr:unnamed protein product [Lepeophtheirus salmonis]CAG9475840.1 unnamed protein product [Lepeophtheirus salmonis]